MKWSESESCSVMSDSLWLHGILYSPWNSASQNIGVGSLLRRIFLTRGLNPGLPHCRWILYQQGSPRMLEWVAHPFSSRSPQPRNRTRISCITGILHHLSYLFHTQYQQYINVGPNHPIYPTLLSRLGVHTFVLLQSVFLQGIISPICLPFPSSSFALPCSAFGFFLLICCLSQLFLTEAPQNSFHSGLAAHSAALWWTGTSLPRSRQVQSPYPPSVVPESLCFSQIPLVLANWLTFFLFWFICDTTCKTLI